MVILVIQVALDVLVANPGEALCYVRWIQPGFAGRGMEAKPADGEDKSDHHSGGRVLPPGPPGAAHRDHLSLCSCRADTGGNDLRKGFEVAFGRLVGR